MRFLFLIWITTVALLEAAPASLRLIAHRGGIVDDRSSENSPASLEAAVQAKYWMIECDIRETKDHRIIVDHDPDLKRFYGDPRRVQDLTFDDLRKLRATPGGAPPMSFRELTMLAKGRLRLMVDIKEPEHSPAFYSEIEQDLRAGGLLEL